MTKELAAAIKDAQKAANKLGSPITFEFMARHRGTWGALEGKVYPIATQDHPKDPWMKYQRISARDSMFGSLSEVNAAKTRTSTVSGNGGMMTDGEFRKLVDEGKIDGQKIVPIRTLLPRREVRIR